MEPYSTALITADKSVAITIHTLPRSVSNLDLDPILLSIFSHRFMSIAEQAHSLILHALILQMGRTLQRTSISTNIKERLDFSCALFGPDGGLVANAPHIPVN